MSTETPILNPVRTITTTNNHGKRRDICVYEIDINGTKKYYWHITDHRGQILDTSTFQHSRAHQALLSAKRVVSLT